MKFAIESDAYICKEIDLFLIRISFLTKAPHTSSIGIGIGDSLDTRKKLYKKVLTANSIVNAVVFYGSSIELKSKSHGGTNEFIWDVSHHLYSLTRRMAVG